jgi:hypothetical protein
MLCLDKNPYQVLGCCLFMWDTPHDLVKNVCDYFKQTGAFNLSEFFMYRVK